MRPAWRRARNPDVVEVLQGRGGVPRRTPPSMTAVRLEPRHRPSAPSLTPSRNRASSVSWRSCSRCSRATIRVRPVLRAESASSTVETPPPHASRPRTSAASPRAPAAPGRERWLPPIGGTGRVAHHLLQADHAFTWRWVCRCSSCCRARERASRPPPPRRRRGSRRGRAPPLRVRRTLQDPIRTSVGVRARDGVPRSLGTSPLTRASPSSCGSSGRPRHRQECHRRQRRRRGRAGIDGQPVQPRSQGPQPPQFPALPIAPEPADHNGWSPPAGREAGSPIGASPRTAAGRAPRTAPASRCPGRTGSAPADGTSSDRTAPTATSSRR